MLSALPPHRKKAWIALLISLLAGSILQSWLYFDRHFSHIDDVGVAAKILAPDTATAISKRKAACSQAISPVAVNFGPQISESICSVFSEFVSSYFSIPLSFSYAPGQFFATSALLKFSSPSGYEEIKFWGRLPSLLAAWLGFAAVFLTARHCLPKIRHSLALCLSITVVVAFSVEHRLQSFQMHSYAIGLLSSAIIIGAVLKGQAWLQAGYLGPRRAFLLALVAALACFVNYQGALLLATGFLALGICQLSALKLRPLALQQYSMFAGVLSVLSCLSFAPFLLLATRYSAAGIPFWARGTNNEFIVTGSNIFERTSKLLQLLLQQTPENLGTIFTPVELHASFRYSISGVFVLLLIGAGLFHMYQRRQTPFYKLSLYWVALYFGLHLILLYFGKIGFSPTRHLIYHLLPLTLVCTYGVLQLSRFRYGQFLSYLPLLVGFCGLTLFPDSMKKREDPIFSNAPVILKAAKEASIVIHDQFDPEVIFLAGMPSNISDVTRLNSRLCSHISWPTNTQSIRVLWYSKRRSASEASQELTTHLQQLRELCSYSQISLRDKLSITEVRPLLHTVTQVEVEANPRTHNGTNSLYLDFVLLRL